MLVPLGGRSQQLRDRFNSEIISANDDGRQKYGVISLRCSQFAQPSGGTERPLRSPAPALKERDPTDDSASCQRYRNRSNVRASKSKWAKLIQTSIIGARQCAQA
jgi:hypothetical protein